MRLKKFSLGAIITLIAVFFIAGVIACSGDTITGSRGSGYSYTETPPITDTNMGETPSDTNTGDTNQTPSTPSWDNDPNNDIFYPTTYMNLYTPWSGSGNNHRVSYQNVKKLTAIWSNTINHGKYGDGRRWMIRDGNNSHADPRVGNYYYFDKNLDIVYVHNEGNGGKYNVKVRKFIGGVVVDYSHHSWEKKTYKYWNGSQNVTVNGPGTEAGKWVVGGLYETALNKSKDSENGGKGYCDYNNDYLNAFMHAVHNRQRGYVEVVVMNIGYSDGNFNEFGLDLYYSTLSNYDRNKNLYLGQHPDYTKFLNWRVNMSPNWGWGFTREGSTEFRAYLVMYKDNLLLYGYRDNYKFFFGEPYSWHLE